MFTIYVVIAMFVFFAGLAVERIVPLSVLLLTVSVLLLLLEQPLEK